MIWIGCPNVDNEQVYQSIPGNRTFLQGCAVSLAGDDSGLLIDTKALEAELCLSSRLMNLHQKGG